MTNKDGAADAGESAGGASGAGAKNGGAANTTGASGGHVTIGEGGAGGDDSAGGRAAGGGVASSAGATSGGASGSSGAAGTTGVGGTCATGSVTFTLLPPKGAAPNSYCTGCAGSWLTITNSDGKVFLLDRGCNMPTCGACNPSACPPLSCQNVVVPATGLTRTWDETQWVGSTCGAASVACVNSHCMSPGKYKAQMCVYPDTTPNGTFCSSGGTRVCVDVNFELPGADAVVGTLGG